MLGFGVVGGNGFRPRLALDVASLRLASSVLEGMLSGESLAIPDAFDDRLAQNEGLLLRLNGDDFSV